MLAYIPAPWILWVIKLFWAWLVIGMLEVIWHCLENGIHWAWRRWQRCRSGSRGFGRGFGRGSGRTQNLIIIWNIRWGHLLWFKPTYLSDPIRLVHSGGLLKSWKCPSLPETSQVFPWVFPWVFHCFSASQGPRDPSDVAPRSSSPRAKWRVMLLLHWRQQTVTPKRNRLAWLDGMPVEILWVVFRHSFKSRMTLKSLHGFVWK